MFILAKLENNSGETSDFLLLLVLCLVVVVPGGVMWIRYGFVKGTDGYNRYGPDPTK